MIPEWCLNILLAVLGLSGGGALYFLSKNQCLQALWIAFFSFVLLGLIIVFYVRNTLILKEDSESLKPKLIVSISPQDFPDLSRSEYKYPFQEYRLHIVNNNRNSAPVENLKLEIQFPYVITQLRGKTEFDSGGPVWVGGVKSWISENGKVTRTEGGNFNSLTGKGIDFSISQSEQNGETVNSHIALFSCEKLSPDTSFEGSIVVDLSKKPKGFIKTPDELGRYRGKYEFTVMGKKFPIVPLDGEIPKPNIDLKLAENHYDQGIELTRQGDCGKAILEFNSATSLNPKHHEAYYQKGLCHGKLGLAGMAKQDFSTAIELSPKYSAAYFNRAVARSVLREGDKDIGADYKVAYDLGFERALKPYLISLLQEVNPETGFMVMGITNSKILDKNGEYFTIIPHVSKKGFQIHCYRDKDNILKVLLSNAFSKNATLKFENFKKLTENYVIKRNHELKIAWNNGENMLFLDGALVDVYPKEAINHAPGTNEPINTEINQETKLFRMISSVDPTNGNIEFTVSKTEWLENNGEHITIIPHIITNNFEIHAYRDQDFNFKFLISNAFSEKVVLGYNELIKLKDAPSHPKHVIKVSWGNGEDKLFLDGILVDNYRETPTDKNLDQKYERVHNQTEEIMH